MDLNALLVETVRGLLTELSAGPPGRSAFVLNPGDRGLLESLRPLTAAQASARHDGRSSIASHVRHLHFGLSLLNRWAQGEDDPFTGADWNGAWRQQQVTDAEWARLLADLGHEVKTWREAIGSRPWNPLALGGTIGSVAHLAYHMGAIRQLDLAAAGPRETN